MTRLGVALVLAGTRPGGDRLARELKLSHKAFISIGGTPMILRVLRAIEAAAPFAEVLVAIEDPDAAMRIPALAALAATGRIRVVASAETPAATVHAVLSALPDPWPALVTTADSALLTADMIRCVLQKVDTQADAIAGLVEEQRIRAAYPDIKRTYLRFSDGAVKGANLFLFTSPAALGLISFWRASEQYRKNPWRLVRGLGLRAVLRFLTGRLSLDSALRELENLTGCRLGVVTLPFAEAGLDVDDAEDLAFAERILARRAR